MQIGVGDHETLCDGVGHVTLIKHGLDRRRVRVPAEVVVPALPLAVDPLGQVAIQNECGFVAIRGRGLVEGFKCPPARVIVRLWIQLD